MGWTLRNSKTEKLTNALAKKFASMTATPKERSLSERRLAIYRVLVEKGEFRPCLWAMAICKETKETFRVNGQHTSILFSQMEETPDILITVETYECDTVEDVARLYSTFDAAIASRTANDINRAFAATIPELANMPSKTINLAVTGMSWFRWRMHYCSTPPAERAEQLLDHVEFVTFLNDLLAGGTTAKSSDHLRRGPAAGAIFGTWQKSHRDAKIFWEAVRDETGNKPDLPDRKLARFLLTISISTGRGSQRVESRQATPPECFAKCLHAWNAWRKNERTDLKYYPAAKLPEPK